MKKKKVTRRSAKSVVEELVNDLVKDSPAPENESGADVLTGIAFILRDISNKMDWHDLRKKLEKWMAVK